MPYIVPEVQDERELFSARHFVQVPCDFCAKMIYVPKDQAARPCFCSETCFRWRFGGGDNGKPTS